MILPFTVNALSATTANVINGTAPYLTFNNGDTKVTTTEELLGITLSDGITDTTYIKRKLGEVGFSDSNPIELPVAGQKLKDIKTLIPATKTSINLSDLITTYHYWKDDDGDGNITLTTDGTLSLSATDVNGNSVGLSDTFSACNSPYKVTLASTAGKFETQYGIPREAKFDGSTADYYIKPKIVAPYSCFAKPNLKYGDNTGVAPNGQFGSNFAGPTSQWDSAKGFKFQSTGPNFPTTGSNNLSFELTIAGATAQSVIDTMTSTVQATTPTNISLELSIASTNVIKVTLQGPKRPYGGAFSSSTFKLRSGTTEIYNFTIDKWFIARPTAIESPAAAQTYCSNLGYNVPKRIDYTNSPYASAINFPPQPGASTGSWIYPGSNNTYTRTIGGGLFAEWGYTANTYYTNSDWEADGYWASEMWSSEKQYFVDAIYGRIDYGSLYSNGLRAACVMP